MAVVDSFGLAARADIASINSTAIRPSLPKRVWHDRFGDRLLQLQPRMNAVTAAQHAMVTGGLDPKEMGRYWQQHREHIRGRELHTIERCVFTSNYTAVYRDDLNGVFAVLDEMAEEPPTPEAELAV